MEALGIARLAPLAGVAFVAAAVTLVALEGGEPSEQASSRELLAHWDDRAATALLGAFVAVVAAVALLTFAACLRARLRAAEPGEATASAVAFAGAIVAAAGALGSAMIGLAASNAAEQGRVESVPALNALAQTAWLPLTGGFAALLLASGVGGLRSGALPRLLSWVALLLGAAFVTPVGIVAFFVTPLWIVAVSIVLYRARSEPRLQPGLAAAAR